MSNQYILNSEGKPFPADQLEGWARWFENAERHVGLDTINGVTVSTVFLGIDHSFGRGDPILWETMTFTKRKGSYKFLQQRLFRRYTTAEEAKIYHGVVCESVKRNALTMLKVAI